MAKLCHGIEYLLSASDREERRHKKAVEKKESNERKRERPLSEMEVEKCST